MTQNKDYKTQRDRFLAFAFAAADMLVEVDQSGKIIYASGAVTAITGTDENKLIGMEFTKLFRKEDIPFIETMTSDSKLKTKQGPYLVKIESLNTGTSAKNVFISGFVPQKDGPVYLALTLADALLSFMEFSKNKQLENIPSLNEFEHILRKKMQGMVDSNQPVDVQLLQLDGIRANAQKLDSNSWEGLTAAIARLVMESSIDGETAVKVDDEKYMILKDAKDTDNDIQKKIMEIAKQYNIEDTLNIQSKTIEGQLDTLSARETSRAILYTIKKMEKDGLEAVGDDLKASFNTFLEENANKISNLKRIISHQDFKLNFQPINNINDKSISHHEVLVRFDSQTSPYELITMGEDIGMAPDMDLAICRQALKYADMNRKKEIGKLAVNLSGLSIQSEIFTKKLLATLDEYPEAAKHLMFEITESSEIKDLEKVDSYIQKIRKKGYAVCLDDFGAGAASFQYLHKLNVDGIKIDGSYVRNITESPRDASMVKNLTQMCHEMSVYVVAEMIETEEQAALLEELGVDKGQGWLYGRPKTDILATDKKQK
ncbi:MAG TPA: EAL domain-containing protein [Alphaproteobacteria bacterium]|nr:EAL domain-containing protein [Alphaproteobacteria bacterium]HNS44297.1 EAL domain-containing protein [Alphaproteobacteria bacterium]